MNETALFRAWAIDHPNSTTDSIKKRMFYNVCLEYSDSKWFLMVRGMQRSEDEDRYWFGFDTKLMQYTGLKDKNGVKIYEGDVVKAAKASGRVRYLSGTYCVGEGDHPYMLHAVVKDCQVIGNIYENPELVKSGDE